MNDTDLMPFGTHRGIPMQDVPVSYLHYLWNEGLKSDDRPVAEYIRKNLNALKLENPDLIWD
jgi:hypothetical protein